MPGYLKTKLLGVVVHNFIHSLPIHQVKGHYFRPTLLIKELSHFLSSQTAFPIFPVIFLLDTIQMITSCGIASLVGPLCSHSSLNNSFSGTSHSMFVYDGRSSSWSGILLSRCPCMLLNSIARGIEIYTLRIMMSYSSTRNLMDITHQAGPQDCGPTTVSQ